MLIQEKRNSRKLRQWVIILCQENDYFIFVKLIITDFSIYVIRDWINYTGVEAL